MQTDIAGIHKEIDGIHKEIAGIHKDIAGLQKETADLRKDIVALKQDLSDKTILIIRWNVGTMLAIAGLIVALIKLL